MAGESGFRGESEFKGKRDFYDVLGVPKTATAREIQLAWRKMALKYHPDRNPGDPDAEEKFKEAAAAYEVLGDPDKRNFYDRFGMSGGFGGQKASPGQNAGQADNQTRERQSPRNEQARQQRGRPRQEAPKQEPPKAEESKSSSESTSGQTGDKSQERQAPSNNQAGQENGESGKGSPEQESRKEEEPKKTGTFAERFQEAYKIRKKQGDDLENKLKNMFGKKKKE